MLIAVECFSFSTLIFQHSVVLKEPCASMNGSKTHQEPPKRPNLIGVPVNRVGLYQVTSPALTYSGN